MVETVEWEVVVRIEGLWILNWIQLLRGVGSRTTDFAIRGTEGREKQFHDMAVPFEVRRNDFVDCEGRVSPMTSRDS